MSIPEPCISFQGYRYFGAPPENKIPQQRHHNPWLWSFWGLDRYWILVFLC